MAKTNTKTKKRKVVRKDRRATEGDVPKDQSCVNGMYRVSLKGLPTEQIEGASSEADAIDMYNKHFGIRATENTHAVVRLDDDGQPMHEGGEGDGEDS